ncbi:hypothetical protein ACFQQB_17650 [Nonomuraea rubra]|uniref:hypothetical protein n=1 Tax=Nonomuraea rubra TaxID=46180 RepID=UPI003622675D
MPRWRGRLGELGASGGAAWLMTVPGVMATVLSASYFSARLAAWRLSTPCRWVAIACSGPPLGRPSSCLITWSMAALTCLSLLSTASCCSAMEVSALSRRLARYASAYAPACAAAVAASAAVTEIHNTAEFGGTVTSTGSVLSSPSALAARAATTADCATWASVSRLSDSRWRLVTWLACSWGPTGMTSTCVVAV